MMQLRVLWLALLLLLSVAAQLRAYFPAQLDPKAVELLDKTADAYHGLKAYADEGTLTLAVSEGENQSVPLRSNSVRLAFLGPEKIVVDGGGLAIVRNGEDFKIVNFLTKRGLTAQLAQTAPLVTDVNADKLDKNTVVNKSCLEEKALFQDVLLTLLLEKNAKAQLMTRFTAIVLENDQKIMNTNFKILKVESAEAPAVRLFINSETHFIQRIEILLDEKTEDGLRKQFNKKGKITLTWTTAKIDTKEATATEAFTKIVQILEKREKESKVILIDANTGSGIITTPVYVPSRPGGSILELIRSWIHH